MSAEISAATVSQLRAKTGAPMMACKKALLESGGDMAKAEDLLRVKLGNKAGEAAQRITAEGVVAFAAEGARAALVELNCETDFVARNEAFLAFARDLAALAAARQPADTPALLALPLPSAGKSVEEARKALIGQIGENISVRRCQSFAPQGATRLAHYLHGTRIGVVVEYQGEETAARDAAMQIAAMKPLALSAEQIPKEVLDKERAIATERAAASGKPADIASKMSEGAVRKFMQESALLSQAFVKDPKVSVADMLKAHKTTLSGFTLYVAGEGLEKRSDDFASEVAAQAAAAKR